MPDTENDQRVVQPGEGRVFNEATDRAEFERRWNAQIERSRGLSIGKSFNSMVPMIGEDDRGLVQVERPINVKRTGPGLNDFAYKNHFVHEPN